MREECDQGDGEYDFDQIDGFDELTFVFPCTHIYLSRSNLDLAAMLASRKRSVDV